MRFMVIVKATKSSEAGALPSAGLLAEMGKFNEDLAKAGVLLAAEGLRQARRGRGSSLRAKSGRSRDAANQGKKYEIYLPWIYRGEEVGDDVRKRAQRYAG